MTDDDDACIIMRSYYFLCMLYAEDETTFTHFYKKLTGHKGRSLYKAITDIDYYNRTQHWRR